MLRTFLILLALVPMAIAPAMAQESFTVDPPKGFEQWKRFDQAVDNKTNAIVFLFKDQAGLIEAMALAVKNGEERNRKKLDLGGATETQLERTLLEDFDKDERIEAVFFVRVGDQLKVIAWEWLGTSIFTEPEAEAWTRTVANDSSDAAFTRLRSQIDERIRQEREKVVIREAIEALESEIKVCAERAIIKNGLETVAVVISFEVDAKGVVKRTGLVSTNLDYKPSEKCVEGVVSKLDFKGLVIGPLAIEYPLEFPGS